MTRKTLTQSDLRWIQDVLENLSNIVDNPEHLWIDVHLHSTEDDDLGRMYDDGSGFLWDPERGLR